jgi:hypothetical protein
MKMMATQCVAQLGFDIQGFRQEVVARFDAEHGSSDGGAVLLKMLDDRLRLSERLTECLHDGRQASKVHHEVAELLRQRIFGLCCGYEDANDAARLGDDPVHKLLVGRDPIEGAPLASQPTLSRFENSVGWQELYRMGNALADLVIETQRQRRRSKAKLITIDLDPTDDPTHGHQQLSLFNGHYDSWCYLPVVGTLTFGNEPEQHAVCAVLRAGNAAATLGAQPLLARLIAKLRRAFPRARLRVRLDGGFATPAMVDFLEERRVQYVVAMAKNKRLKRCSRRLMAHARRLSRASGRSAQVFGETQYAARSWSHERRVVIKAEVVRLDGREPRDNARFVITNIRQGGPEHIYDIYRGRGDMENRLKELHYGLNMDRTSCSRFTANQFRVLLTLAAYVLMQQLRQAATHTDCARAQVGTLRDRLLKIGAWVERSVRRIVLHLPTSCAWANDWRRIALSVGAVAS